MNSSSSLFLQPLTSFSPTRKLNQSKSSVWERTSWPAISATESLLEHLNSVDSSTSDRQKSRTEGKQSVEATFSSHELTSMLTESILTTDNLNGTSKPTSEKDKGVDVVTILLVISSCLLLWIIIIVVGLVIQRLEKRKQNAGNRREGSNSKELERSHDSGSQIPLHLRARMIYQGLQSYDISNQVPNGVAKSDGSRSVTPQGINRRQDNVTETLESNGNHIPRKLSDLMIENSNHKQHDDNANETLPVSPGVKIIITEPSEMSEQTGIVNYDNEGLSSEVVDSNSVALEEREDSHTYPLPSDNERTDESYLSDSDGVINEGFSSEDIEEKRRNRIEETTEL